MIKYNENSYKEITHKVFSDSSKIKFEDKDTIEDWDECPICQYKARHPITNEYYSELQNVLWCANCQKNFISSNL